MIYTNLFPLVFVCVSCVISNKINRILFAVLDMCNFSGMDNSIYTTMEPTMSNNPNVFFHRSGIHPGMMYWLLFKWILYNTIYYIWLYVFFSRFYTLIIVYIKYLNIT